MRQKGCRPESGWGEMLMPSTPVGPPSFSKDQSISLTCRILKNVKMTNKDPPPTHTAKQREYEGRAGAENSSYRF